MFYERYLKLCTDKGIKPSAAATNAGFNRGTVSVWKKKYESGIDVAPDQETIDKICAYFGCSEQWLRGIEKAPSDDREREIGFDDFTYAMHDHSADLTEQDKEILLQMARQLAAANRRKPKDGETD